MHDRIKQAFDDIRADEAMKDRTRTYLWEKTQGYHTWKRKMRRRWVSAMACFAVVLLGTGGYFVYFTPTSAISIDINPSMELAINRFDQVIGVQTYGQEESLWEEMPSLKYLNYSDAIEKLLAWDAMEQYLAQDQMMAISVIGTDEKQNGEMLNAIQSCTQGHNNITCHAGNAQEVQQAHQAGLSFGKYQVFLQLQALDPTITVEEVQDLTMRQLQDWLEALQETSMQQSEQESQEVTNGGHYGHGNHYGYGYGGNCE